MIRFITHQNKTLKMMDYHYNPELFLFKPLKQKGFFNLKSSKMSQLVFFGLLHYPCLWSMSVIKILILSVRGSSLYVRICRLQTSDSDI